MAGFEDVRKGWSTETRIWGFERPEAGRKAAYVGVTQKAVGKVAPMSRGLLPDVAPNAEAGSVAVGKVAPMRRGVLHDLSQAWRAWDRGRKGGPDE